VGYATTLSGTRRTGESIREFTYENGVYAAINVPGAQYTIANGINDSGQVVGYASYNGGDIIQGFLYDTESSPPSPIQLAVRHRRPVDQQRRTGRWLLLRQHRQQYFIYYNGVFTDINVPGSSQHSSGHQRCRVFGS